MCASLVCSQCTGPFLSWSVMGEAEFPLGRQWWAVCLGLGWNGYLVYLGLYVLEKLLE